jgi:hypothetical protein
MKWFAIFVCSVISNVLFAQTVFSYDASGNRVKTMKIASTECNTCPSKNIAFQAGVDNASFYQWQVDTGTGYYALVDDLIYSGATSKVLVLLSPPKSWYGYRYRCQITSNSQIVHSQESILKFYTVWKGSIDSTWETIGNWSCRELPDEFTDVIIGSERPSILKSNAKVRTITLNTGGKLTIVASHILEVKK